MSLEVVGRDLQVGDTIEVWWEPHRDTITGLFPYIGPLDFLNDAWIASFALGSVGMTIVGGEMFTVIAREGSTV